MINLGYQRSTVSSSDRYIHLEKGHMRFPQIPTIKSKFGRLSNHKRYKNLENQLQALGRTIRMCLRQCVSEESQKEIINKYESITIQKYIENIVPIIIEKNKVYAHLTLKHSLKSRVSDTSTIETVEIAKLRTSLVRKYKRANTKLFKEIWTSVKDECDNLKIDDVLDEAVRVAFYCEDEEDEGYDVQYLYNKGHYWDFKGISTVEDKKKHEEEIKINIWPTNFEELIKLYEDGKKEAYLLFLEAEEIALNYKKRKVVESYGYNTNSTKQDSTQVPLSFDTIS
jgi:hypothetical protein